MAFRISPTNKNSIIEIEKWINDESQLYIEKIWRWGTITTEEKPDLTGYDPLVGINVNESFYVVDSDLTNAEIDIRFSADITEDLKTIILKEWFENMDDGLIKSGWSEYETECWLIGELEVDEEQIQNKD